MANRTAPSRMPWWLLATLIVFTAALGLVGVWLLRQQRDWLGDVSRRAMATTTATRANELLSWRTERLAEAASLQANRHFVALSVSALSPSVRPDALDAWNELLAVVLTRRDYAGAALFSPDGSCRRRIGATPPAAWQERSALASAAVRSRRVELSNPFSIPGGQVRMVLSIPLDGGREATGAPAAVVALEIDAQPGMLTLLRGRVAPGSTSEFLLVRRERDGVTVLSGIGRAGLPAIGTRLPGNTRNTGVDRVVRGIEGPFDGRDSKGERAVSVSRRVGNTDWWLLASVAETAGFEQFSAEARQLAVMVGLIVLAASAVLLLVWQRRQAALYQELYQTEARRKVLAESYGHLTRFANDIILFSDDEGRIVEANDRAVEAYGYSREELIGMPFAKLRTPEIQPRVGADLAMLKTDGSVSYQADHLRKDGTRFPVDVRARHFVQDGHGFVTGIIRDITERVNLERQLRDSAETYRKLFEGANDAIVLADADTGIVIDANQKAAALTGRTVEELRGLHQTQLHPPERNAASRANFQKRAQLDQFETIETFLLHADGRRIPVEVNASRIELQGRPVVLGVFRDQSERIEREQELFASESRRQKLESLALLAGGIAHDFNNLLTGIVGNISLATHAVPPGSDTAACLEAAEQASMRAKELTQQLLTFSKGGAPIKKVVDMVRLLHETVAFACRGTSVMVDTPPAEHAVMAEADEGQIAQVINNISLNAVQAMPAGGRIRASAAEVTLEAGNPQQLAPGRYARLVIADTGMGIAPQLLPRVFDPYFTTKQQGSGLGLAISHSIVLRHGGFIGVHSQLGEGTSFEILIPSCDARMPEPAPGVPSASVRPARVLVMDDEADIRTLALRMLERLAIRGEGVADGEAALRAYRKARDGGQPFDAVIMDLTIIGGMGGKDATAALLEIDPAATVIVSSGYSTDPIMGSFRDFGFKAVLAKPYKLEEMRAVLGTALGRRDDDPEPATQG